MRERVIITGFGGQGVLLIGRLLADAAILAGYKTTWYPFYEGQIRGAMVNCYVTIASSPIGLPVVYDPTSIIVMSDHSLSPLESLESSLPAGGSLVVNSSIVRKEPRRKDVRAVKVPANRLAEDLSSARVANLVAVGAYLKMTGVVDMGGVSQALERILPPGQRKFISLNRDALRRGYDFAESAEGAAACERK
jgi:2-oxoglutarate ferredoxin oxidoreductase subunit gamma